MMAHSVGKTQRKRLCSHHKINPRKKEKPVEGNFDEAVKQLIDIGKRIGAVQYPVNGIPFTIVPIDSKLESLEKLIYNPHNERPERKTGTVKVLDSASFCEYWRLFSDA